MEPTIEVLYEDNHIIIVNKSAGLLSQPTDIEDDSLEVRVKAWIKEKYKKPGNVFIGVVHRLDKPTSGILVFAKTSKALSRLNDAMRSREMQKTYCAFVEGRLRKKEGTLEHYLVHGDHSSYVSDKSNKEAKLARLHYKVLKEEGNGTFVEIVLDTGRYHQIRCQFAAIGHPVVGDLRYGAGKDQKLLLRLPVNAVALHHSKLVLTHPVTKVEFCVEAPLPSYFA